jgi:hypothetical protein
MAKMETRHRQIKNESKLLKDGLNLQIGTLLGTKCGGTKELGGSPIGVNGGSPGGEITTQQNVNNGQHSP